MATTVKEINMTPEQQAVHDAWIASLSGRQTKQHETAQKIKAKVPKPVSEGRMAQVLASKQKYRVVA